jgi:hypothetical protein
MTNRLTEALAGWSVRAYPLVLHAYPASFKQEFGDSMSQLFADLVRGTCRDRGLPGLAVLWMRTAVDVVLSLARSYAAAGTATLFRPVMIMTLVYLAGLTLTTGYGSFRFREFYQPPAFTVSAGPALANLAGSSEDALVAAHGVALNGELGSYTLFVRLAGLALAAWLGLTAAFFGRWQQSVPHGAAAFVAGVGLTVAAFELMPSMWFPFDRYSVGFIWVLMGLPLAAVVWTIVALSPPLASRFRSI